MRAVEDESRDVIARHLGELTRKNVLGRDEPLDGEAASVVRYATKVNYSQVFFSRPAGVAMKKAEARLRRKHRLTTQNAIAEGTCKASKRNLQALLLCRRSLRHAPPERRLLALGVSASLHRTNSGAFQLRSPVERENTAPSKPVPRQHEAVSTLAPNFVANGGKQKIFRRKSKTKNLRRHLTRLLRVTTEAVLALSPKAAEAAAPFFSLWFSTSSSQDPPCSPAGHSFILNSRHCLYTSS